jgi:flagellar motility protein MotE (MotC chaperone)
VAVSKKWYSYFVVTGEQDDPADASAAGQTPTSAQRVSDVLSDTDAETTFSKPVAGPTDLGAVYDAAKISAPAHGYTVLKVAEMLRSEHIRALPADVRRKSVMVALDAAGVKVTEIVEDAVRRDRALDTYERVLRKSVEDLRAQTAAENKRIEDEIAQRVAELRARIDENNKRIKGEQDDFLAWQNRKQQEEETIAEAVGYFVSESPITTTRVAKDQGDADVR